ncbi:CPBP family intramembrane glutamic endopeptidase [uncultured Eudoraea sp.]|uniref:CPBP family intramembrane glutamic endopeptidase n=1 Tax=uncultured Eudoraea sp. TaxID=1035614 RepID=UPI00261ECD8C|nr:CPBP family intramembrane glutamic endopeptidase [uncultured Eudoraea sp.]
MNDQISKNTGWQRIVLLVLPYIFIVGLFGFFGIMVAEIDVTRDIQHATPIQRLTLGIFDFIGTFLLIWIFMKYVDKQNFIELGFHTKNRFKEFFAGIIIGGLIMSFGYLTLFGLGEISFQKIVFDPNQLLIVTLQFAIVAIVEETLFRGYILKNLMVSFNKYLALTISSILFALVHSFNPNISWFALFELFIGGVLLGLTYIHTKNLWFPIALHFSWNLFQSLLGFNVSGIDSYSIVEHQIVNANYVNGGPFGFEGSVLSLIAQILLILGIIFFYAPKKSKQSKGYNL